MAFPVLAKGRLPQALSLLTALLTACGGGEKPSETPQADLSLRERMASFALPATPRPLPDPTNKYADDPAAAELGKKFFFDTRFSGPLLDQANNGQPGTLGKVGETGKVACASCHVPSGAFADTRSTRGQISLGAAWSHRRAPSLLDVGQRRFLNWDGSRDAAFSQPFTPIEDAGEFNSSRLFVAQQIQRLYLAEYEAVFGPFPDISAFDAVEPADAGCNAIPDDVVHGFCEKPGHDDPNVTRVVVNMGKAIQAYTRQLSCGPGRFDAWLAGDDAALSADEQAGAALFMGKGGCTQCHRGPYFTDDYFHNVGMAPNFALFVVPITDNGASDGIAALLRDPLNSKGDYSDGSDDRQDVLPDDPSVLLGAFKTPSLRCVNRRPSFMRTGQFRSLEDVVYFFARGGNASGFPGQSENRPRDLSSEERAQLVAFLRALDGPGPDPSLIEPPTLPSL